MFRYYNPNPAGRNVGDCAVRALTKALGLSWDDAFCEMFAYSFAAKDMPSSNAVWGDILRDNGFARKIIPNDCIDCYDLRTFCEEHPEGVFVVALPEHTVAVINGDYYDAWDSGSKTPLYYWEEI